MSVLAHERHEFITPSRRRGPLVHRLLLAVSAILIAVPGVRLLVDTAGYARSKDNLVVTPDLHSELNALGATFVAAALVLAVGVMSPRFRLTATAVGVVAFVPQGALRLLSYATDDGQHSSYLRAGVIETVVGLALTVVLVHSHHRRRD